MNNQRKGFTLVELLVAMFIFAMIAVVLIPNVTQSAEKNLFTTQLKKVHNDVQQAMLLLLAKNQGTFKTLCIGESANQCFIDSLVGKPMDVATQTPGVQGFLEKRVVYSDESNDCETNEAKDPCAQMRAFLDKKPQFLNKEPANFAAHANQFYAANMMNGATISVIYNANCNGKFLVEDNSLVINNVPDDVDVCGYMEIDVNASKVPNTVGKDIHFFWIVDGDGLVPFGEIDEFTCKAKANDNLETMGCTYSIIQKGKIDFY